MRSDTDTVTSDELVFAADQVYALHNAMKLEFLRFLDRIEQAGAWREDGATSLEGWVAYRYAMLWPDAVEHVNASRALRFLPQIADAFGHGRFSWGSLVDLCSFVAPEEDETWAERAGRLSAAQLRLEARRARRIRKEEAEQAQRQRYLIMWRDAQDFLRINGRLPGAEGAIFCKAIERLMERYAPLPDGTVEPYTARQADALVDLAGAAIGADSDTDRATVVVHVGARDLNAIHGNAMLEDGTFVPSEVARRLACDGYLEAIGYGSSGHPIGIGRRSRIVPPALARTVKERDGGRCVMCGSRNGFHIHHLKHWAHGGRTDLDNLVLACRKCHRLIHDQGFRLVRNQYGDLRMVRPDGRPVMNRPAPLRPAVRERMLGPARRTSQVRRC